MISQVVERARVGWVSGSGTRHTVCWNSHYRVRTALETSRVLLGGGDGTKGVK